MGLHPLLQNIGLDWNSELWLGPLAVSGEPWTLRFALQPQFEYLAQIACWIRLCILEGNGSDDEGGFNSAEYWQKHVLLADCVLETLATGQVVEWTRGGPRLMELLSVKLDGDSESEQYRETYKMVWRLLSASSVQKFSGRGPPLPQPHRLETLGMLWSMKENEGKDKEPGTFAELLRYGSVNFTQTRETIECVDAPPPYYTFKMGHLEL